MNDDGSNVLKFPVRERSNHEKLTEISRSEFYVNFWFDEQGQLHMIQGEQMSSEQLSYLSKFVDMLVHDKIRNETYLQNEDE